MISGRYSIVSNLIWSSRDFSVDMLLKITPPPTLLEKAYIAYTQQCLSPTRRRAIVNLPIVRTDSNLTVSETARGLFSTSASNGRPTGDHSKTPCRVVRLCLSSRRRRLCCRRRLPQTATPPTDNNASFAADATRRFRCCRSCRCYFCCRCCCCVMPMLSTRRSAPFNRQMSPVHCRWPVAAESITSGHRLELPTARWGDLIVARFDQWQARQRLTVQSPAAASITKRQCTTSQALHDSVSRTV